MHNEQTGIGRNASEIFSKQHQLQRIGSCRNINCLFCRNYFEHLSINNNLSIQKNTHCIAINYTVII